MHKSQANRARIAARAAIVRPAVVNRATGPLASLHTAVVVTGPVRRTRALPMTGAQRDSTGAVSDWARSATVSGRTGAVIRDARWSHTVQGNRP